jgi:Flp pilus assembly protein TadG
MISFIRKRCQFLLSKLRCLGSRSIPPHLCSADAPAPAPCAQQISIKRNYAAASRLRGFFGDKSGAVIMLVALAMPVLVGTMGLAAEASYWFMHQRAMQNAADAAAIAAATNATSGYAAEAQAVAAQLGFQNGSGNITVQVAKPSTAAGCTANCYTVTISDDVPLFLSQVIGYGGNTTVSNKGMTAMSAAAVATSAKAYPYCILALSGSVTTDIVSNGAPKANLNGCNIMANSGSTCNGHNLNAAVGDAHGSNNGCGIIQRSNVPIVADPYARLASNIPANTCSGTNPYPQEPAKKKDPALPASNQWSGSYTLSGNKIVCGDQQLTANVEINAPSNAVLVIENGQLDTNGYTLQTSSGSGLTIVFTGTNTSGYTQYPTGGGALDIAAPTSGSWSGMAIYQDPNLTISNNINLSAAGNSPTWDISGMVYMPNSNVTFSGAVSKASNGAKCFGMTVGSITINGTGDIFANDTQCSSAGLTLPEGGSRGTLVN